MIRTTSVIALTAALGLAPLTLYAQEEQPAQDLPSDSGSGEAGSDTDEAPSSESEATEDTGIQDDAQEDGSSGQSETSGEQAGDNSQIGSDTSSDPQDAAPEDSGSAPEAEAPSSDAETGEGSQTGTASDASQDGDTQQARAPRTPTPIVPEEATWNSFHGQLNAQKYSPLDQINADNVGELEKVWEYHTGDVSDGSGDLPATVWSATPIFANDTLYHRHALLPRHRPRSRHRRGEVELRHQVDARGADPARAQEPRRRLLGGREPGRGRGLPEDRLSRHDGRAALRHRRRYRRALRELRRERRAQRQPVEHDQRPLAALAAAAADRRRRSRHHRLGRQGLGMGTGASRHGLLGRSADRRAAMDVRELLPEDMREQTGTANVWTAHVAPTRSSGSSTCRSPRPRRTTGAATGPRRSPTPPRPPRSTSRPARWSGRASGCTTTSGTTTSTPRRR